MPGQDKRGHERRAAERIYLESGGKKKPADIARELNIDGKKVRNWKYLDKWDELLRSGKKRPGKVGAPYGNQNGKGGRGNPHPNPPPDRTVHGGYKSVVLDALSDDEKKCLELMPDDPEELLVNEIRIMTIREYRLLKAIDKYRGPEISMVVADVTRRENGRSFKDSADGEERISEKVRAGDRLPGEIYQIETHTMNADLIMIRLSQELTSVQSRKIRAIDALARIRTEKRRQEDASSGTGIVDEWIAAVMTVAEGRC